MEFYLKVMRIFGIASSVIAKIFVQHYYRPGIIQSFKGHICVNISSYKTRFPYSFLVRKLYVLNLGYSYNKHRGIGVCIKWAYVPWFCYMFESNLYSFQRQDSFRSFVNYILLFWRSKYAPYNTVIIYVGVEILLYTFRKS